MLSFLNSLIAALSGVFVTPLYLGELLNDTFLLTITALGAFTALSAGEVNLGGEGEVYIAGCSSALVILWMKDLPQPLVMGAAFLCAVFSGALIPSSAFLLYRAKKTPVIVTSYLFSLAVCSAVSSLIIRTSEGSLLATPEIPLHFRFAHILPPSFLSYASLSALFFEAAFFTFFTFTRTGKRIKITGKAPRAAYHAGYRVSLHKFSALSVSGAMHGVAGFFLITSTYYCAHLNFHAGFGWNALSVALLASGRVGLVLPSSFLLSWIFIAVDRLTLTSSLPLSGRTILEGIFLFVLSSFSFYKKQK